MSRYCGACQYRGNVVLTSYPPQIRCDITGEIHHLDDGCTLEFQPVVRLRGHWIEDEARIKDQCSACGLSVNWLQYKTPYCPFCGAKMDED